MSFIGASMLSTHSTGGYNSLVVNASTSANAPKTGYMHFSLALVYLLELIHMPTLICQIR